MSPESVEGWHSTPAEGTGTAERGLLLGDDSHEHSVAEDVPEVLNGCQIQGTGRLLHLSNSMLLKVCKGIDILFMLMNNGSLLSPKIKICCISAASKLRTLR